MIYLASSSDDSKKIATTKLCGESFKCYVQTTLNSDDYDKTKSHVIYQHIQQQQHEFC